MKSTATRVRRQWGTQPARSSQRPTHLHQPQLPRFALRPLAHEAAHAEEQDHEDEVAQQQRHHAQREDDEVPGQGGWEVGWLLTWQGLLRMRRLGG